MITLVVATHNTHKLAEFRRLLRLPDVHIERLPEGVPDAPETGDTFVENAEQKALFYTQYVSSPVLSDDSGLCVALLGGEPGVYSARYAGLHGDDAANNQKLIQRLHEEGVHQADGEFVCALSVCQAGRVLGTVEGRVPGIVYDTPKGTDGFGYDPLFEPAGYDKRYAEMTAEAKGLCSHRAVAAQQLAAKWKEWFTA